MPAPVSDIQILLALHRYHVLSRKQFQYLLYRSGKTASRTTRRRLLRLKVRGLIIRHMLGQISDDDGSAGPVYYLSKPGREYLARALSDPSYLETNRHVPRSDWLLHWLAISDTHIALDRAVDRPGEEIHLEGWINEYDLQNPKATKSEEKFLLYTLIAETPDRITCQPDAGFLLSLGAHKRIFFLEQDRGSMWPNQVAGKTAGYAGMAERHLARTIFPEATSDKFFVLLVTTDARRRDALRKVIRNKPRADLWKFTTASELTPEPFFDGPVFYRCDGDPEPLVRRPRPEGKQEPETDA